MVLPMGKGEEHPRGTRLEPTRVAAGGRPTVNRQREARAVILCQSSIMRGAIAASLESDGIDCIDGRTKADVAIVVTGLLCTGRGSEADALHGVGARKWVVLSRSDDDPVFHHLIEQGLDPCMVPEDIDGRDLCHVVRLAASDHVLSMGRFCRNSHPGDARRLAQAGLEPDQWRLLEHLSNGLSNKEIAIAEDTSESAIKSRLRCLLHRLDLSNRTKAAVLAVRCGIGGDPIN